MPKWVKTILAICLLPLCVGAARALWKVLGATGPAELVWVAVASGAACWLVIYLLLPKPMRLYILGHELTHVLWTWLFGGRVKRFRASARGGQVVVSKSNFLVALSPYFFPIYAATVVLVFVAGNLVWDWRGHLVWLHFLLGASYAFHITLTWRILQSRQSDITGQGYLFSAVIIFLGNVGVLLVGLPLLTARVSVLTALGWWLHESGAVVIALRNLL